MSRYVLRHIDVAGIAHVWTVADTSAHWVARWHASDSGRPTEVWREGVLVTVWHPTGDPDPDHRWDDAVDDPHAGLYATQGAEHPDPRGIPCPEPAEDNSEGLRHERGGLIPWT